MLKQVSNQVHSCMRNFDLSPNSQQMQQKVLDGKPVLMSLKFLKEQISAQWINGAIKCFEVRKVIAIV